MRKEVEHWWKQALADLKTAKDCLSSKNYYMSAFACQQAVEKALKAYFLIEFKTIEQTHNVFILGQKLNVPKEFQTFLRKISFEYLATRYPDVAQGVPSEMYDETIAGEYILQGEKLIRWLEPKIK